MSNSSMDNALRQVLEMAEKHLPNTHDNAVAWFDKMDWLFTCAQMGCKLRTFTFNTLGEGPVNVGYPGYAPGLPYKVIMQERKILIAVNPNRHESYHLQWKDGNDKSKGFEIVHWANDHDSGTRYDIKSE